MIATMLISKFLKTALMMRRWLGIAGILYLYHPLLVLADGMFTDMAAPYESCGYCHEYDGNPTMGNYPKIAGQKKQYIIKQMRDYHSGRRDGRGMMDAAASLLSDHDLQTVAEFFSKQKPTLDKNKTSSNDKFAHARQLWLHGAKDRMIDACVLCHGSSDDPELPYLRGQHAEYLSDELHAFKNKTRTNDEMGIMRFFSERLSDSEISELSQFISMGAGKQ